MSQTASTVFGASGVGFGAAAAIKAGNAAKKAGDYNATAIVDEADYNARVAEYNSKVSELQQKDAISRGQIAESTSRSTTGQQVGAARASFGAQGLNLDVGSPSDVVQSIASNGAVDAMTVRLNAAREAWGFGVQADSEKATAGAIRNKGTVDAYNAKTSGDTARRTGRFAAATTILGGAGALLQQRYGFRKVK